jgi:type IV secretion system protein VirB4
LTTLQDTPYFFNFHRGAAAHTIVLGKPGSGHTTLSHFLVAQARKLDPQIWYLDGSGRAGMFLQAMGGKTLQPGMAGGLRLNPLQLPDAPAHREFLAFWLATLFDPEAKQLNQATLGFFQMLIDAVMKLPLEHRRLSTLLPIVAEQDAMLAVQLKQWCAGGKYGDLFDMPQDQFAPEKLIGWDISAYRHDMAVWNPLSAYLLHRITAALNGNPTLLVLGEGFDILSNPLFALRAGNWFDHLTKQNTACLVHTAAPEASGNYAFTPTLAQKAASLFILPDADPDYSMGYGLDAADLGAITHLDRYKRQVLLKRGAENTVVKIDLSGLGSALTALSGRKAPPMAAGGDKTPEQLLNELMGITPTEVA